MIKPLILLALAPCLAHAAAIFAPGNTIFGVRNDGANNLLVSTVGVDGGNNNYTDNTTPANETPDHAIDGVGQKYLNFAELNTGVMASPTGSATIATSLQLWTANDADVRDPATYEVWGTNLALNGGGMAMSDFTLISSGALALPVTRNGGGATVPDVNNSQTVNFANSTAYQNYLILFPTVKNEPSANSMQIAEIQLFGTAVPEPGSLLLAGLSLAGVALRRRRA